MRIGLLSNPLSGGNRKGLAPIRAMVARYPRVRHCQVKNPLDVAAALDVFARDGVELLAVNGGDGTVHAVLTMLFRHQPFGSLPKLALLKAGTASMLPRDVGLPGEPQAALERLLRWAQAPSGGVRTLKRPILRVDPTPEDPPLYGMFFGAGGIYQGILFCHQKVNSLGIRGEIAPGLTLLFFLTAFARRKARVMQPVKIEVGLNEQKPQRFSCLAILASTLERLFLGLHPFWGTEDAPMHFTMLRSQPIFWLRTLPGLLRGRTNAFSTPDNGYLSRNLNRLQLTLDTGFTIDGELYSPAPERGPVSVQTQGPVEFIKI